MAYATVEQVEAGFRMLDADEQALAEALLEEAAIIIDATREDAPDERKALVSCRMVRRGLGTSGSDFPMGASQGSMTAGPFSQSWTMGASGSSGELYISKQEKKILGAGDRIGVSNPLGGI